MQQPPTVFTKAANFVSAHTYLTTGILFGVVAVAIILLVWYFAFSGDKNRSGKNSKNKPEDAEIVDLIDSINKKQNSASSK